MFRWLTLAVLVGALAVSGFHRARARRGGETIPRRREGPAFLSLRALLALVLFGSVLAHAVGPGQMAWASFDVPEAVRWSGLVVGVLAIAGVHWVLGTLGRNVSETVLTKERHELVTGGPYRWIRHPLYTTGLVLFLALGLMAGSWLVLCAAVLAYLPLRLLVIPREEQALLARFGERYRAYMRDTGRLLPRARRGSRRPPRHL